MAQPFTFDTGRLGWVLRPLTIRDRCLGSLAVAWTEEQTFHADKLIFGIAVPGARPRPLGDRALPYTFYRFLACPDGIAVSLGLLALARGSGVLL